jgi:lysophospholipase L1-like esterase
MNVINADTDELSLARAVESGETSPELYRPPLEEFVRMGRDHNFIPLVIIVPSAYTIYDRNITYSDPSVAPLIRGYSGAQRNWLAQNAAGIGYQFFDPTDALQEQAATRPLLYFPANVHPTAEGQKALAEAVAPTVKALLAAP